ncbi:MAG: hypothetical protein ACRELG_04035 [Gemmataceae bacterium]
MDAVNPRRNAETLESEQCQCDRGQDEAMNQENLPLLAAYRDAALSIEAADQLVQMTENPSHPAYAGEDLPEADKAALLRKAALQQKNR